MYISFFNTRIELNTIQWPGKKAINLLRCLPSGTNKIFLMDDPLPIGLQQACSPRTLHNKNNNSVKIVLTERGKKEKKSRIWPEFYFLQDALAVHSVLESSASVAQISSLL